MKLSIPNSATVDSAFRTLEKRLKRVRDRINANAAGEMKSGNYSSAEQWMDVGRSVADFGTRVEAFTQEWKRLGKATRIANAAKGQTTPKVGISSPVTPVWKFCTPALEVLASRGGSASQEEMITGLEHSMSGTLTPKDRTSKSQRNPPRWHGAVKKAYKQCQREGWIEKRSDGVWKITPKGRGMSSQESGGSLPTSMSVKSDSRHGPEK